MLHPRIISQGDGLPTQVPVQEQLSRLVPEQIQHQATSRSTTIQETPNKVLISVPYILGLSEEFKRVFKDT